MENIIEFKQLQVTLGNTEILTGIDAGIPRQSCTAIVGPNGAGKTTMLYALLGQIPYRGQILINGRPGIKHIRVGYVPQRLMFDRGMPITITDLLALGEQRRPLWLGMNRRVRARALELLTAVNAEHLQQRMLGALSGGELQRVLLALALQQNPDLLILDEPASGVDIQGEQVFCEILERLRRKHGFTQLMVSHDLSSVTHHATHVICLNKKVIAEGAPKKVLTHKTLMKLFGLHMGLIDSKSLPENCVDDDCNCHRRQTGGKNA